MALSECKVLAALLSLVAALFLLAHALPFDHHGSSRLRGPGATLADLLLAALDRLQDIDILELATRRNMVLLCHAILLLVLRDAGLLGASARRRRSSTAATTNEAVVATESRFYSPERSPARGVVVWRPRNRAVAAPNAKKAAIHGTGHLKRHRRPGTQLAVAVQDPRAAPSSTETEQGAQHESTKQIVLVEEQRTHIHDHHLLVAGEHDQVNTTTTSAERELLPQDCCGEEEEEDLDEMNRRFEAFIADTKEKMRLEALQPVHVPGINVRQVLSAC